MNILMFGWEFPPTISGGLGVACHGLVQALHERGTTSVSFILPRLFGQEDTHLARFIGACENTKEVPVPSAAVTEQPVLSPARVDFEHVLDELLSQYAARGMLAGAAADLPTTHAIGVLGALTPGMLPDAYQATALADVLNYARCVDNVLLQVDHPGVIHAHDWLTFLAGVRAKELTGSPLVVHVHSTEVDRSGRRHNAAIRRIEQLGMVVADQVIAVSEYTRQLIIDHYHIDPAKVVVIHNAATVSAPLSRSERQSQANQVVSFIGRVTHQKGPRYFVEAASQVVAKNKNVRFVLAGTGDLLAMMKALVNASGLRAYFEFPGFLAAEEVRALLAKSDVYVMPSVSEPFGIAALEAVQAGVPVVLSQHCGVSEVIESCMKVDLDDISTITNGILALLENPTLARTQAEQAQVEAASLSWANSAQQLEKLYHSIAKKI